MQALVESSGHRPRAYSPFLIWGDLCQPLHRAPHPARLVVPRECPPGRDKSRGADKTTLCTVPCSGFSDVARPCWSPYLLLWPACCETSTRWLAMDVSAVFISSLDPIVLSFLSLSFSLSLFLSSPALPASTTPSHPIPLYRKLVFVCLSCPRIFSCTPTHHICLCHRRAIPRRLIIQTFPYTSRHRQANVS